MLPVAHGAGCGELAQVCAALERKVAGGLQARSKRDSDRQHTQPTYTGIKC